MITSLWLRICIVSLECCVGREKGFLQTGVEAVPKDLQVLISVLPAGCVTSGQYTISVMIPHALYMSHR